MKNERAEPAIVVLPNDESQATIHKLLVQVARVYDVKVILPSNSGHAAK